jgi:hypothetical protein
MSTEGDGPLGFGDLDDEAPVEKAAPRRQDHPSQRPPIPPTNRYTWFVGVAALVLIVIVFINTLSNGSAKPGVKVGHMVPPFAAPLARSTLTGDANISANGGSKTNGEVPACSIHRPDVFNVCAAYRDQPLVLAFMGDNSRCIHQLDTMQVVSARFPRVNVAAVAVRGDRGHWRDVIRTHGWTFPVAYDRDNAVANQYGMAVCPQIAYIRRGGRAAGTTFGDLSAAELASKFAALQAGRIVPK